MAAVGTDVHADLAIPAPFPIRFFLGFARNAKFGSQLTPLHTFPDQAWNFVWSAARHHVTDFFVLWQRKLTEKVME